MTVEGDESSLMEYTTKWIRLLDRGGLFQVNDAAFSLFREVELCIRDNLTAALASREGGTTLKEQIVSAAMSDQDVQHFWTLLTGDLNRDEASDLLREIIQQWITIRSFSIAGHWNCIKMSNPRRHQNQSHYLDHCQ